VHLAVVVAENLNESSDIGVAVDAEEHASLLAGAVPDVAQNGVVAGEYAGLKGSCSCLRLVIRPQSPAHF
jgi:hypothetical protein